MIDIAVIAASIAPVAPRQCPWNGFVEEMLIFFAWSSPNTRLNAFVSMESLRWVEVPCALM